jgi:hypothetical protein
MGDVIVVPTVDCTLEAIRNFSAILPNEVLQINYTRTRKWWLSLKVDFLSCLIVHPMCSVRKCKFAVLKFMD